MKSAIFLWGDTNKLLSRIHKLKLHSQVALLFILQSPEVGFLELSNESNVSEDLFYKESLLIITFKILCPSVSLFRVTLRFPLSVFNMVKVCLWTQMTVMLQVLIKRNASDLDAIGLFFFKSLSFGFCEREFIIKQFPLASS